ncbi:MAG: ABC transporter ATP-binding protein, partial [Gemmatimonadota bacterium]|nr:ABC transporter ATP-binding protein [Gemmatimonadota bacterium]
ILLCTHIIPDVEAACDRVIVLVGGKRVREGTVQELLSGQVPLVELTVQGTTADQVRQYGIPLESAQDLTDRVLLRARPEAADALLRRVLEGGGRVTQLQPARFSLEDLFLQAMSESKVSTVGGDIQ